MSDQPETLILVYLRRLETKMDGLIEDVAHVKRRLTTLEIQLGQTASMEASHYSNMMLRMDRFESYLQRIDRRLDMTEAAD